VTGVTSGATVRRRRPRDRKQLILDAAAARFFALGYHQVGMADIAADVDIAPSALYRHFRGKQELLLATMNGYLDTLENRLAEPGDLEDLVGRLVDFALGNREFGLLWERESGLLPVVEQRAVRHRLRAAAHTLATAVACATGAPQPEADLRALAILSMLDSPAHQYAEPDRVAYAPLLRVAAEAIARVRLPMPTGLPIPGRSTLTPASRRETLLAVAIRLFAQRGYPSVGLVDIGAATGIAGPSVYNHFASKIDLLVAALNRGTEVLWFGLHRALVGGARLCRVRDRGQRHRRHSHRRDHQPARRAGPRLPAYPAGVRRGVDRAVAGQPPRTRPACRPRPRPGRARADQQLGQDSSSAGPPRLRRRGRGPRRCRPARAAALTRSLSFSTSGR
jgi:AcrR family transcriptional regulator